MPASGGKNSRKRGRGADGDTDNSDGSTDTDEGDENGDEGDVGSSESLGGHLSQTHKNTCAPLPWKLRIIESFLK